jgi:predicted nicotinamide N-methyase
MNHATLSEDWIRAAAFEELLNLADERFGVRFEPVSIGGYTLDILQFADLEEYIDRLAEATREEQRLELPFWAKIWPTSILLSHSLLKMTPDPSRDMLEIGAGIGLCGLFAAKHGFRVTITDNEPDALLFAQINILKNSLQDRAAIDKVDFTTDRMERRFPLLIGSEVLYRENDYRPLIKFLQHHIEPSAEAAIMLAKDYKLGARKFFKLAEPEFSWQQKTLGYRERSDSNDGSEERHLCSIFTLRPKKCSA